jgi:hypothetical protein
MFMTLTMTLFSDLRRLLMRDIIADEINRVYPGKGNNNEHQRGLVKQAIDDLEAGFALKRTFVQQWIGLFTLFSDERAIGVMQSLYLRVGKPIPDKYRPVVNAL